MPEYVGQHCNCDTAMCTLSGLLSFVYPSLTEIHRHETVALAHFFHFVFRQSCFLNVEVCWTVRCFRDIFYFEHTAVFQRRAPYSCFPLCCVTLLFHNFCSFSVKGQSPGKKLFSFSADKSEEINFESSIHFSPEVPHAQYFGSCQLSQCSMFEEMGDDYPHLG